MAFCFTSFALTDGSQGKREAYALVGDLALYRSKEREISVIIVTASTLRDGSAIFTNSETYCRIISVVVCVTAIMNIDTDLIVLAGKAIQPHLCIIK